MTAAVLSAAGVLCGKKQKVAKWLKISAKWCSFGLAEVVKSSRENVMTWHFCVLPDTKAFSRVINFLLRRTV